MKTISLFRAGKFFFGIDADFVSSTHVLERGEGSKSDDDTLFLHAASLFTQEVAADPEEDQLILELTAGLAGGYPPLLVTGHVTDCPVDGEVESLPAYFPEPARRCVPEIMAHGEETVLLLDPQALYEIWEEHRQKDMLVSASRVRAFVPQVVDEIGEMEETGATRPTDSVETFRGEQGPEDGTGQGRKEQKADPVADGDPVRGIIAWVVEKYGAGNGVVNLQARDIPAALRKKAGLPDSLLDYLLKETLARCRKKS